jgi:hypothetical protein
MCVTCALSGGYIRACVVLMHYRDMDPQCLQIECMLKCTFIEMYREIIIENQLHETWDN